MSHLSGLVDSIIYHILELLLTQCVDLSKRDQKGNTALHYACLASAESAALMLLERIEPELIDSPNADLRTYHSLQYFQMNHF